MKMIKKELQAKIKTAMRQKNHSTLNVCRVALGEIQTIESRNGSISEEEAQKVLRKMIQSNTEMIECSKDLNKINVLKAENELLDSLLPKLWDQDQIVVFFLNGDGPELEMIQEADNFGAAMGLAMKVLKRASAPVEGKTVKQSVEYMRNSSKDLRNEQ